MTDEQGLARPRVAVKPEVVNSGVDLCPGGSHFSVGVSVSPTGDSKGRACAAMHRPPRQRAPATLSRVALRYCGWRPQKTEKELPRDCGTPPPSFARMPEPLASPLHSDLRPRLPGVNIPSRGNTQFRIVDAGHRSATAGMRSSMLRNLSWFNDWRCSRTEPTRT